MARTLRLTPMLLGCVAFALAGCGGAQDDVASADSAAAIAAAPAPAPMVDPAVLARWEGTWDGRSMPMEQDTVLTTWTMTATPDPMGWTITFPGREPVPMRVVEARGDSVTVEFGPYESTTRPGEQQTVRGTARMLEDGRTTGTYEARIASQPDSVYRGRSESTRRM